MRINRESIVREREWVADRADTIVPLANRVRSDLGEVFGVDVAPVSDAQYQEAVTEVFEPDHRAVNIAALIELLRDLDVTGDYPGFVIDEYLGRELAAMIAGEQPLRLLAEATFHYADVSVHTDGTAGADDLDAALAAGFQTRLPGWEWREKPFDRETGGE